MARFQKRTNYVPTASTPVVDVPQSAVTRFNNIVDQLRNLIPALAADSRLAQSRADYEIEAYLLSLHGAASDLVAKFGGEKSRRNEDGEIVF